MSTTDQPTIDGRAPVAGAGGWAVPGVDHMPGHDESRGSDNDARAADNGAALPDARTARAGTAADPAAAPDAGGPAREAPAAGQAAVAGWREDLAAATGTRTGSDAGSDADARGGVGHVHPVIAAVATCLEALDGVREAPVGTLSAAEVRLMLLAVVQVITAAFALKLRLIAAGTTQRVADLTGATCTAGFLAHLTQTGRPEARAEVRLAEDLEVRYLRLGAALARGAVGVEQVKACVVGLRRLPKTLPVDQLEAVQDFLIEAAQTMTPAQLKRLGKRLWEVIDPDGADRRDGQALEEEERLARAKAYFRSWRNGDGSTGFRGRLPDAQADMLLKLLHAYAAPRRRNNPNISTSQPDNCTHLTGGSGSNTCGNGNGNGNCGNGESGGEGGEEDGANADTGEATGEDVGEQATASASSGDRSAGNPPGQPRSRPPDPPGGDPDPQPELRLGGGRDQADQGVCDGTAADPCLDEESAEEAATGKTIPYPVRLGHALIDLIEHIPATAVPDTAGAAASVLVTIGADQLSTGLGVATLDTGTAVSAGQARRLACAAGLIPLVLDGRSEPLDVGREQRLHTRYQRLAAAHRQGHACGIHGCDRPITAYHHPVPWSHGGPTSLANCLGLCGYHHHLAHHPHWRLDNTDHTWTLHRL